MPTFLNPLLSVFISMLFFGILFVLIIMGINKLNSTIKIVRLRRKLAAAKMVDEAAAK